MILVIGEEGALLLPIVFNAALTVSVVDWNTIYSISRRNVVCGIVSEKDLREQPVKLPAYVVLSA